jgi:hypothetical protein
MLFSFKLGKLHKNYCCYKIMLCLMFAKSKIVKAVFILIFDQKYSCQAKYPAGYPVSGPYWISGIRLLD